VKNTLFTEQADVNTYILRVARVHRVRACRPHTGFLSLIYRMHSCCGTIVKSSQYQEVIQYIYTYTVITLIGTACFRLQHFSGTNWYTVCVNDYQQANISFRLLMFTYRHRQLFRYGIYIFIYVYMNIIFHGRSSVFVSWWQHFYITIVC